MILDTHQHFWHYLPNRDNWIDGSMTILKRDFLPKDLQPILKANGVEGCIAVQADQSEAETEFLLSCADKYSFIKGVVGWVDLCDNLVEERLAFFSKNPFFKGVRHIVQAEKEGFVLQENFQRGISKLAHFGLTYDLLIYPHQMEAAIKLAELFPLQQFILDHIAKPNIKKQEIIAWKASLSILSQASNVSCKLSGMVTEANWKNWKEEEFTPYMETVIDCFGEDRILFGSDWPVCLLAAEYNTVLKLVEDFAISFSEEAQAKLFGQNAMKIYNIND
jgi:L-fuconolactonase